MTLRYARTAAIALLALVPLAIVGHRAATRRFWRLSAPDFRTQPVAGWFVVHEKEAATLDESRIGRVGFPGSRPELLHREPLQIPPSHPLAELGGTLILETVIGVTGNVVKARVLRGIETPELRRNLIRCLRVWRFSPAVYQGENWSVVWNVTIRVWPPGRLRAD